MSPAAVAALILIVGVILLLSSSIPVAVVIGIPSLSAAMAVLGPTSVTQAVAQRIFTGVNSFSLLAIPFFVLAGMTMNRGGIVTRLIDAAEMLMDWASSSLAQTSVVANIMFGAASGAAVAVVNAVGTVVTPYMKKEGYSREYSAVVNAASAPAGTLIPPPDTSIVYSLVSSTSIAALFVARVGPGLLWVVACLIVAIILERHEKYQHMAKRPTVKGFFLVMWRAIPLIFTIFIVIGGILLGWFAPTESATIAVVYCLVLSFICREVRISDLPKILLSATRTTSVVMLLMEVSSTLSWVMSFAYIPQLISDALLWIIDSPAGILIIMILILLFVGTFMDPTPAILVFMLIFLPIAGSLGINPVHFGAMMVMNLSVGIITPSVGNMLFIGSQVAGLRIESVIRKLLPFLMAIVFALFLVAFIEPISIRLPTVMGLVNVSWTQCLTTSGNRYNTVIIQVTTNSQAAPIKGKR